MSSLRQEIGWRLLRMNQNEILADVTDDILKLIENRIDSLYIIPKRKIKYTDIELQRMEIYADVLNQVKRVLGLKK